MIYLPGLRDHRLNRRWRGEVLVLGRGKLQVAARVYGDTLEEMRDLKAHLFRTLNDRERSIERDLRNFIRVADR